MADLNPDDPILKGRAPHELAGVLRWHRAKVPSRQIMELLHLRGTQLIKSIELAHNQEAIAIALGIPVHDELIEDNG